ncbi:MAG: response regulator transcription factor [Oscillospiraceae bacterium]
MKPILIVEDEKPISRLIEMTLRTAGYATEISMDGENAANKIEITEYDLVLLDIMLPKVDGYELMEYIKPLGTPVIFITAKSALADKVKGLRMGADDYIVKPFEPAELLARVEMVLRRAGRAKGEVELFGVTINTATHCVSKGGEAVALTHMEYELLIAFLNNRGIALFRDVLYERVWGDSAQYDTRTLDIHVHRLRKKLSWEEHICTIPKIGYRLEGER